MTVASHLLLVEGDNDGYVVAHLVDRCGIDLKTNGIDIQKTDGVEKLIKNIPVRLKSSGLSALGILVDADEDADRRWQGVRTAILKSAEFPIPDRPVAGGFIGETGNGIRVGIWVMPNNKIPGRLEDFVALLVDPGDVLWPVATTAVDQAIATERRFGATKDAKARIHTWLAWQEEPGAQMGQAITRRYLKADSPIATDFVAWFRRLFLPGTDVAG